MSLVERISAVRREYTSVKLGIENEQAEMNVLEPLLAQTKEEERAYTEGIRARVDRKDALEIELEIVRFALHDAEKRSKELNLELESMRSKVFKATTISACDITVSRRTMHPSEVPKLVSFLVADGRKLREVEAEKCELEQSVAGMKSKLILLNKRLKETMASHPPTTSSIPSFPSRQKIGPGFIPSDLFGAKRKREEQISKELEQRKPNLGDDIRSTPSSHSESLGTLSILVSYLSDDDENMPQPATDELIDLTL
jgi:hypothetical protein